MAGDARQVSDPALPQTPGGATSPQDWLVGGGEMGKFVRSMDWSRTPLGPIECWPQSLRTTVSLCLASNFPISLAWGPQHVQIYNDGYWPICGGKHPTSMGQDFSVCWASAWPAIGEVFAKALAGQTSYLQNQRMFLDRNGYLEETFFTFSFSPIRDETGGVGGLFHPVTETTERMLSERRTRALRDLAARPAEAQSLDESVTLAAQTLSEYELDLPFTLFYLVEGSSARLVASSGLGPGTPASPLTVDLAGDNRQGWPLARVLASGTVECLDLKAQIGEVPPCRPYPEPPRAALLHPIALPGSDRPLAVLVTALSPRLPLTEAYRAFCDLLAAAVTTVVTNVRAHEEERRRAEALAEIDRAKTAFFSNVSHEFRTPLTLILGTLEELLSQSQVPPAAGQQLEVAHRNSLRLLRLVNSLLDFSRIEAGRARANYQPTDLAALTADLASAFRAACEKAGLHLRVDCPPMPGPVRVDRDMWEKIVLNLLSNAFKFTLEGEIEVKLACSGTNCELSVRDTGIGIPDAELPRIFERFHRVEGTRGRTLEGTGIGLSLVRELVQLHGGTVSVRSALGGGTTFTIAVPFADASGAGAALATAPGTSTSLGARPFVEEALRWLPDANPAGASDPLPRAGEPAVGSPVQAAAPKPRERVLLADDNADMRDYVRRLLAGRFEVEAVADGLAALEAARRERPALLLSDIMMPGLDGFGLLRQIRADPELRTLPVILLSARAGEESKGEGLEAGADDYLVKPFSARELLARVTSNLTLARVRDEYQRLLGREEALKETDRRKNAFLAMLSHELRNPLAPITNSLFILKRAEPGGERSRRALEVIARQADHLARMVEDLLEVSRITQGKLHLRLERLDLRTVVRGVAEDHRATFEQNDIALEVRVDDEPLWLNADRTRLAQVMGNLLANAAKFTPPGGRAEITAMAQDEATAVIRVSDNGAGMPPDVLDRLFEPFVQADETLDRSAGGLGLGLAMVKGLVELHGGTVHAHSDGIGRGVDVTARLPLHDAAAASAPHA